MIVNLEDKKPKFAKVRIEFDDRQDWSTFSDVRDGLTIDCGDFSDERLQAIIAETSRKLAKAWHYMRERKTQKP